VTDTHSERTAKDEEGRLRSKKCSIMRLLPRRRRMYCRQRRHTCMAIDVRELLSRRLWVRVPPPELQKRR
jgi:hypothetical protein